MNYSYEDFIKDRFGYNEFTTKEFEMITDNKRPAKLLSELKMRNTLEHTGRGTYKLRKKSNKNKLINEINRVKNVILNASMVMAYTDSTAVEIWTKGRYIISPNSFMKIFYITIKKDDLNKWKIYLRKNGVSCINKRRVGVFVMLKPVKNFEFELIDNIPVIPKNKVINLIRNHPALYEGAKDLIE